MPYIREQYGRFEVVSESTHTVLRFHTDRREFSLHVIAAGVDHARVVDANGRISREAHDEVRNWLKDKGYKSYTYEKQDGRTFTHELD